MADCSRENNPVAAHYNARARDTDRTKRATSAAIGVRRFNNAVKRLLITDFARGGGTVLDVCCGKGGDLAKYRHCGIGHYSGIDISPESTAEANRRYRSGGMAADFTAAFVCGDIRDPLPPVLSGDRGAVDLVACQFALHYVFGSADSASRALANIAAALTPGGHFVATLPAGARIRERLTDRGGLHTLSLPSARYGVAYHFYLEGVVDCPEYVVDQGTLRGAAAAHGLDMRSYCPFGAYCEAHGEGALYAALTADERAVVDLYAVAIFQKAG